MIQITPQAWNTLTAIEHGCNTNAKLMKHYNQKRTVIASRVNRLTALGLVRSERADPNLGAASPNVHTAVLLPFVIVELKKIRYPGEKRQSYAKHGEEMFNNLNPFLYPWCMTAEQKFSARAVAQKGRRW